MAEMDGMPGQGKTAPGDRPGDHPPGLQGLGYCPPRKDGDTIRAMEKDSSKSLLEESDSAMLDFVIRAMKNPTSISATDIARLKDLGWEERDMVDALAQGVGMIDHAIMMQVFQIDQNCIIE